MSHLHPPMGAVLGPLHPALTHVSRHVLDQRSARQGTASFPFEHCGGVNAPL